MQFCYICPTSEFARFGTISKRHLVLAQHCGNREYYEFYRGRIEAGDEVILDNGLYEGQTVSALELRQITKWMKPTIVVAPDCAHSARETWERSMEFKQLLEEDEEGRLQKMLVLHAPPGDIESFKSLLVKGVNAGFSIFGLSRLTETYDGSLELGGRARFIRAAEGLRFHALGMKSGSVEELRQLAQAGAESCDSSAPIWRGLHGHRLCVDSWWPDYPFNPAFHKVVHSYDAVEHNIRKVEMACGNVCKSHHFVDGEKMRYCTSCKWEEPLL